ncbi:MAG: DUF3842 family protein [Nitrospirae bacterium]|uniref:DUF3842 family protein n=1 Tax=Candidatus Magnetobacterium casense TaxID=1455061 RepID=UPI000590C47D|nr:DUF3842 family protein [Candidatus Magnetobacterium casensis]MBF0338801.1 DUF3842 family protein [Nitrospirota bacterium]
MFKIAVIDAQGGGIGALVVKRLRQEFGDSVEVVALGTNAAATAAMLKSRADKGATGDNAIAFNASRVDVIVGPLGIVLANSMMGELTPTMAAAISTSQAKKLLLPLNQEGVEIIGIQANPLPHLVEALVERIKEIKEVY